MFIIAILVATLCVAAWYDVRYFRIPNVVTVPAALLGIALNSLLPSGVGFTAASCGFALALLGLMPFYFLRMWGAGDVKLMAVVGAFLGSHELFGALLAALLAGGITSLLAAWQGKTLRLLGENLRRMVYQMVFSVQLRTIEAIDAPVQTAGKVAYALPILFGTIGYLAYRSM